MRKILFRGKATDNKWVEGFFLVRRLKCKGDKTYMSEEPVITTGKCEISGAYGECSEYFEYEVIPETLGQYTGLTDKNGTKIFEGDIVTCQTKYGADVGQVIFAMGKFCVWWHSEYHYPRCAKMIMCYDINSKTKVIGNIHDNLELIKGGASDGEV